MDNSYSLYIVLFGRSSSSFDARNYKIIKLYYNNKNKKDNKTKDIDK